MSTVVSARISDEEAKKIRDRAFRGGRKVGELAARYVREGLIGEEYPGIIFRDGPAGRRAHASRVGLDVWEVVINIEGGYTPEAFAEEWNAPIGAVRTAMKYARDHRSEIEAFMPPDEPPPAEE